MKINLVGQTDPARSHVISANRLVNMYAQRETADAKEPASLIRCPGLKEVFHSSFANVEARGAWSASNGSSFVVLGNKLCRVNNGGIISQWTLDSSIGPVSMRDNGLQLILVDGTSGYILTLSNDTFAKITDSDFPNGARTVAYIDTYFIVGMPNTQQFFISNQMDGTAWDALDFFAAEGSPDFLKALTENHRELWLFGARTTEVWASTTDADFPFQRMSFVEQGIAAWASIAKMDNSLFWLGANENGAGVVYRANGYTPQRISTPAIEWEISNYSRIDDAVAFAYSMEGHSFYVLNFPTANKTRVYDAATGLWHERAYSQNGEYSRWRANCHLMIGNDHYVGDYTNGKVYLLSSSIYDDDGQEMLCMRSVRVKGNEMKPISFSKLVLDVNLGDGLPTGQGSDPKANLRISDDGGRSFHTNREITLGKKGNYTARAEAWGLGQSRDRVFEITVSDPVEFVIVGAYVEAKANG